MASDASASADRDQSSSRSRFAAKLRTQVTATRGSVARQSSIVARRASADRSAKADSAGSTSEAGIDARTVDRGPAFKEKERLRPRQRVPEPTPLALEQTMAAAVKAQRARARADGSGKGGDASARAFRRKLARRLRQRQAAAEAELIGGRSAARVAIVGAGPVGLWLAVLLARKHASFANGPNGVVISRNTNAPTIDVFEKRPPASSGDGKAHGTRAIVLAITPQTSDLLNRHLLGTTVDRNGSYTFAPTSRIGEIEKARPPAVPGPWSTRPHACHVDRRTGHMHMRCACPCTPCRFWQPSLSGTWPLASARCTMTPASTIPTRCTS